MTNFEIPEDKYTPKEKAFLKTIFGRESSTAAIAKLKPGEYESLKPHGIALGLVGRSARDVRNDSLRACVKKERVFAQAELAARMEFSEQRVRELYQHKPGTPTSDGVTLASLQKSDPQKYERLRVAAQSYGVVGERIERATPKPKAVESETRFVLSPEIAQKANLPLGTKLNMEEFSQLMALLNPTEPSAEPDVFSTENLMPSLKKDND